MNRRSFLKFIPYIAALALPVKAGAAPRSKMPLLPVYTGSRQGGRFIADTETGNVYKWDEYSKVWLLV